MEVRKLASLPYLPPPPPPPPPGDAMSKDLATDGGGRALVDLPSWWLPVRGWRTADYGMEAKAVVAMGSRRGIEGGVATPS